ncbi:SIR2 family protein [Paraburkholderia graminis]|uniref:P-loop NTPase n=1 Tax=Paraburkholderia graminis TaxID=60548 RepID=UPI00040536FA
MKIPDHLVQQIKEGNVVLFLGAGASIGAEGRGLYPDVPDGYRLGERLCDKFLGGEDKDKLLSVIADYAISEAGDIVTVQKFIRDIFIDFWPSEFHSKIPTYKWAAIVTTNYDQIIERAYSQAASPRQVLCPITKSSDRMEDVLRGPNALPYLKLHGCISLWQDKEIPLILTIDHYADHRKGRERLFDRFLSYASDMPVIFVGYKLEDPDFRKILSQIADSGVARPRYYVVSPNPNPRDIKIWEQKKIEALPGTFADLMTSLEEKIPEALRSYTSQVVNHPIEAKFIKKVELSQSALDFIQNDAWYIQEGMATEEISPRLFYRGASQGWSAIANKLDFRRTLEDQILLDSVIRDDSDRNGPVEFLLIKGHAGAGKSVLLKRLAWDVSVEWKKISLFIKASGRINIDALQEISELTGERLFVFVDRPSVRVQELERAVAVARSKKIPITFVCSERTNEWNTECKTLDRQLDLAFELQRLNELEVGGLLDRLEKHGCLGALAGIERKDQQKAFLDYAGRQLLVALYEVTSGQSFENIVYDEYRNIVPDEAQQMYLIVCSLNRLQVPVRAGIVKRLTGISFADFREKFFGPLESVVLSETYKPAMDMAYRARHPWIAEKVFERVLVKSIDRFDLYIRLLDVLDVGYQSDRVAFREILRARSLMANFNDHNLVSLIYTKALESNGMNPYLLQQVGIYEMKRENGSLDKAYGYFMDARRLAPRDTSIAHSLSELELKRANTSSDSLTQEHHLRAAENIARSLTGKNAASAHGYVTVAKIGLQKLEDWSKSSAHDDASFRTRVKEITEAINGGLQHFPDDPYLLSVEARLADTIEQDAKAISSLTKAFTANKASPYIARSLARHYERNRSFDDAIRFLRNA